MVFDPEAIKHADEGAGDVEEVQYPIIQWVNGNPQLKPAGGVAYHGGWFMSEDNGDLSGEPNWDEYELPHRDGTSTMGYSANAISLAFVRMRRRWEIYEGGRRELFAWNEYEKATEGGRRPTGRTHILCAINGLEGHGLFTLTLRGMVAKEFTDYRNGLLAQFQRTVVAYANSISPPDSKSWRNRYFWMPVCPQTTTKGTPIFTEVGSGNNTSKITIPTLWGIPSKDKIDEELLGSLFVGVEYMQQLDELWHETKNWQELWNTTSAIQSEEDEWRNSQEEQKEGNGFLTDEEVPF